jgi:transposase-like protein
MQGREARQPNRKDRETTCFHQMKRRKFTTAEKAFAVRTIMHWVNKYDYSFTSACNRFGHCHNTVKRWRSDPAVTKLLEGKQ